MGVLDKFRIRGTVKSRFNPGRNNNWDWNELLTTIENYFEGDFDLATLQAQADSNTTKANANTANITSLTADVSTNETAIAQNGTAITKICGALNAAFAAAPLAESAAAAAFTDFAGNPCSG